MSLSYIRKPIPQIRLMEGADLHKIDSRFPETGEFVLSPVPREIFAEFSDALERSHYSHITWTAADVKKRGKGTKQGLYFMITGVVADKKSFAELFEEFQGNRELNPSGLPPLFRICGSGNDLEEVFSVAPRPAECIAADAEHRRRLLLRKKAAAEKKAARAQDDLEKLNSELEQLPSTSKESAK